MEGGVDCSRTVSSPSLGAGKKVGKILAVRVQMLDDTITMFQIQAKALGSVLFDQVCQQVNLLEADYFGLEYAGPEKVKYWLDMEKPMNRQLELSLTDPLLRFAVKFYAPDPAQLEEEFTRYLFCMQIKQDLSQGVLQCNDKTAALIASYLVQAECGDYVAEDYPDHTYLSSYKFVPHQDAELERRIMENHKKHVGQSPAEADLNLLETARRCELYGVKMHPAKDPEGVPLNLAVAHMGVLVFQNFAKINTFSWAKVRKLSFKRKKFLIKLHPEAHGNYKDVVEFHFEGRDECKNFWKKCVEHHGFFRCTSAKNEPRPKPGVLSRGSSFRYTGRTQKEIIEYVRDNYVKRQSFQRSQSFRHTSPHHVSGVGTSMSVHPLLPVGDNVIVASGDTASCGSAAITAEARARSLSTSERMEKVDVHHHQRERDVESPSVTSNNSSSSPQHHPVYQHYQNQPAVFQHHSLPRTGASSAAHPSPSAGQIQSPCSPCCSTTSPHDSSTRLPTVISRFQKGLSQEEDNSFSSSVYTDPTTTEVGGGYKESLVSALEEVISRDSYELLSDSDSIFVSPERFTSLAAKSEAEVPYLLHRRVQTTLASSKSYETVILRSAEDVIQAETVPSADGTGVLFQRSRSFRSLREKTYRERPALFARARLVDIDLDFVVNTDVAPAPSLFRPKSIEFVSYQNLPPPDAFSSRDDTIDPVNDTADVQHFISSHLTWSSAAGIEPPSFPVVVDVDAEGRLCVEDMDEVDEEKMCSLMSGDVEEDDELGEDEILSAVSSVSSGEEPPIDADDEDRASAPEDDEALTADDVRDVDFIYQPDTLSNTTSLDGEEEEREERLVSEDLQLFGEFVNEEDGLPDPDSHNSPIDFPEEPIPPDYDDYIFQAHVLSRISERSSCDSKLSFPEEEDGERGNRAQQQDDTMSDVSSSFKGPSDAPIPVCPPPPIADESTPVNESVPFQEDPQPPSFPCDDQFPSPPSSIDLPDDDPELYSDSS